MKLHEELLALRKKENEVGAQIIEKLKLMEDKRKYLSLGHPSLFDYLVRGLGYSESAAYQKQSCVRLTKELPEIKEKMDSGALTATGLSMAFKSLKKMSTTEKRELLKKIENQPSREIKKILTQAEMAPAIKIQKTEYQDKVVLRLELTKMQNQKLEKLKALNSHKGDVADLLETLIDQALKKYENVPLKLEKAQFKPSRSINPRYVPQSLKNHLFQKANHRCQFPGCETTHFLQVDHIVPVRSGGKASLTNLQILCQAHNVWKG